MAEHTCRAERDRWQPQRAKNQASSSCGGGSPHPTAGGRGAAAGRRPPSLAARSCPARQSTPAVAVQGHANNKRLAGRQGGWEWAAPAGGLSHGSMEAGPSSTLLLHCTAMHCSALHCIALLCTAMCFSVLHCTCTRLVQLPLLQEDLEHHDQRAHGGQRVHQRPHILSRLRGR
jgi:hypothetical protein